MILDAEDKGSLTFRHVDTTSTSQDISAVPSQSLACNFEDQYGTNTVSHDVQSIPPVPRNAGRIPNMKDFLVAFSTIPGMS
jgi:hypothetical protein